MTGPADVWAAAFAKPSKLWQPAPSWKPHEWTPLFVALGRVKDRLGDFGWAEIDLPQDFVTGRVQSALRYLLSDDGSKQVRLLLQPKFWQRLKITWMGLSEPALVEGVVGGQPLEISGWAFFVRTADLDKHYPVASAASPPDVVQPPPRPVGTQPPPRRRGPATTKDWHSIDGEIARRCIDPKTGRVRVPKNESALARDVLQWLEDQGLGQPADSEMREAVRRVCAALRTVQK
jgi:hypothetical protein